MIKKAFRNIDAVPLPGKPLHLVDRLLVFLGLFARSLYSPRHFASRPGDGKTL